MRRLFTFLIALLVIVCVLAQSPEKISYQAIVRNSSNQLVINLEIGMKISILQGSANGTVIYQETYNPYPQTNTNGLVTIEIGEGIPIIGTFEGIDWSDGPYFLKTEIDPTGGNNYSIIGVSQILSVPYALYAKTSGNVVSVDYNNIINKPDFENWDNNKTDDFSGNFENLLNKPKLRVSRNGDSLYFGLNDWVIIPGISNANYPTDSIIDERDGRVYKTIIIGNQTWMAENLAYLPKVNPPTAGSDIEPCYYVYDYFGNTVFSAKSTSNYLKYGTLYNGPAAFNGQPTDSEDISNIQGVCPSGWHLPSDLEWKNLENHLGMSLIEINQMDWRGTDQAFKLKATSEWSSGAGNNSTGFRALPGGFRGSDGVFYYAGDYCHWWTSTLSDVSGWWGRSLSQGGQINRTANGNNVGFSIRCIKD